MAQLEYPGLEIFEQEALENHVSDTGGVGMRQAAEKMWAGPCSYH